MPLLSRARELGATVLRMTGKGASRAKREADVRRMRAQIAKQQREIGRLIYPLIEDGTISLESPEARAAVERIRDLSAQIERRAGRFKDEESGAA